LGAERALARRRSSKFGCELFDTALGDERGGAMGNVGIDRQREGEEMAVLLARDQRHGCEFG
jgi:hypothetical protein